MTSGLFTRVTFRVCVDTQFGDSVFVTGNAPILGYWKTDKGFKLETSADKFPAWEGTALIHSGFSLEYKYIIFRNGEVLWETGPVNRSLKTSLEMMIVDDGWFNGIRVGVQIAPMSDQSKENNIVSKDVKTKEGTRDEKVKSVGSDVNSQGVVIVAAILPIKVTKNSAGKYEYEWDHVRAVSKLRNNKKNFKYVGWIGIHVPEEDQAQVKERLIKDWCCYPVFLDQNLAYRVFDIFCQSVLSPLFHHIIELAEEGSESCWQWELWHEYEKVNKVYSDLALMPVSQGGPHSPTDRIWVLDYEMMLVPHYASRKCPSAHIGYSFLSVFPSTEVFRVLPVRIELLCALLCSDLISFDLFEYARHFLHCCSRLLGLEHRSRRGLIGVDFNGRRVNVRCGLIGFDVSGTREMRDSQDVVNMKEQLQKEFEGKTVIVSCDKIDRLSGISLKLTAFESLMRFSSHVWYGKLVLVQLMRRPYSTYAATELLESQRKELEQIQELAGKINDEFPGSVRVIGPYEENPKLRLAYFGLGQLYLNTSVRTGLDWSPFEFVMCSEKQTAPLCVSEFLGCSRVLSGSFSMNPWNVDCVVDAVEKALQLSQADRQQRLKRLYQFVSNYDIDKWAHSILNDISNARKEDSGTPGLGLGPDSRFLRLEANCVYTHLDIPEVVEKYKRSSRRVILLDYGSAYAPHSLVGNLMVDARRYGARGATPSRPDMDFIESIKALAKDERNTVFLLSSQEKAMVQEWFPKETWEQYWANLGVTAENGCFYRWGKATWENLTEELDLSWKERARKLLRMYTDRVHGTYIQEKACSLVWHYADCDQDWGAMQARELTDHLEDILESDEVDVIPGQCRVEVRPKTINKGVAVELLLRTIEKKKPVDFVLCVGDDRSDEDMFALIRDRQRFSEQGNCAVYACTVGLRPSHAGYYLSEMAELRQLLKALQDKSISANRSYSTTDLTLLDSRSSGGNQAPLGRRRPTTPGQKPGATNRRPLEGLIE
uniref:CBM20 domain-containing protein n=1 Tax=Hanusia phi TaxID=3032 RepID=A0A7S0HVN1_9CRYP